MLESEVRNAYHGERIFEEHPFEEDS
jgi:hypothetical protein